VGGRILVPMAGLLVAGAAGLWAFAAARDAGPQEPIPPTPGGGTILAKVDCTQDFPNCGVAHRASPHYTLTPAGNGARFTLTPGSASQLTQFYTGWMTSFSSRAPALYIRMRLTAHKPFKPSGIGDVWTNKFIICNDGSDASQRAIAELRPDETDSKMGLRLQRNIDGDEARTPVTYLPFDRPVAVQMEIRRGAQGRTAIWIDNPNPAKPTVASPVFHFAIPAYRDCAFGYYQNASLAPDGRVSYTVQDLVVSEAFDPTFR
jgi:hypothetical protein